MDTQRICSVDGCGKRHYARGWCQPHWKRWNKHGDPEAGRPSWGTERGEPVRFLKEVITRNEEGCIFWPYSRSTNGYGNVRWEGRMENVHRVVCELSNGSPPTLEHQAAHSCGNGHLSCCNPKHLSWKTQLENEADKARHGTVAAGVFNAHAKLNDDAVRAIRASSISAIKLSSTYGVRPEIISAVRRRAAWKHVK